jgi:hypothetical protein
MYSDKIAEIKKNVRDEFRGKTYSNSSCFAAMGKEASFHELHPNREKIP